MAVWNVIDHTEVGSGGLPVAGYEKTSISQDYDHLCLILSLRSTKSGVGAAWLSIQVGDGSLDTGNNYSYTYPHTGTGSGGAYYNNAHSDWRYMMANPDGGYGWSSNWIWIPHYTNTDRYKSVVARNVNQNASGLDNQAALQPFYGGLWKSTDNITNVGLHMHEQGNGYTIKQYSTITLYGIKASND